MDDVSAIFSYITPEPVAAASLGQVYKATLRENGAEVAVKVQRPFVLETVSLDLFLTRLAGLALRKLDPGGASRLVCEDGGAARPTDRHPTQCSRSTFSSRASPATTSRPPPRTRSATSSGLAIPITSPTTGRRRATRSPRRARTRTATSSPRASAPWRARPGIEHSRMVRPGGAAGVPVRVLHALGRHAADAPRGRPAQPVTSISQTKARG